MQRILSKTTTNMTMGKEWKVIVGFAIPIFLSNLFQQMYNSVDSIIVGKYIGTNALGAVSSSGNLIFLFTSFFIGATNGAGVVIAKYFGEKRYDDMRKAIHTDIAFGLIAGVLLTIAGVLLSPLILRLMRTDANVLPESIDYFRFYFAGALGVVMYNIFAGIINAMGNSRRTFVYLIISSGLNVLLDLLFIAVFKWGVWAAAVATSISQVTSAILCFAFLLKKGAIYQVKIKEIKIDGFMFKQIIRYGLPSGVQNSVIGLANTLVQSNINTFGNVAMAGCGTYSKTEGFAFLPINSFTLALSTFISQNLGAKEYKRAKNGARFAILTGVIMTQIIGLIMFFFMKYIARLFTDDVGAIEISALQARTICLFYFLLAFSHMIASVCRGAGKAIVPMCVMLGVWCVFRILYVEVAMHINHDIRLLFLAYPITWSISSVIFLLYYKFSDWLHGFEKTSKRKLAYETDSVITDDTLDKEVFSSDNNFKDDSADLASDDRLATKTATATDTADVQTDDVTNSKIPDDLP